MFVKQWYDEKILWKDYPMFLVNTEEGRHAYFKKTDKLPIIQASTSWDSKYGSMESHGGKYFIFLNSILIDNYREGDVSATIIHEILHVIYPNSAEKEIKEMEKAICEQFDIRPERTLKDT
jgi:predicted metal-dependent peptidase